MAGLAAAGRRRGPGGPPDHVRAGGERRLPETELPWLAGFEQSRPVRTGNAAVRQRQLDVYGEVIDALRLARVAGLDDKSHAWNLQLSLLGFLESSWREPDEGSGRSAAPGGTSSTPR